MNGDSSGAGSYPRVVVVGLGPGDPGLVTTETLAAIAAAGTRYVRTTRHPSASLVADAVSFDDVYEAADTFDDVYAEIAERLVAAATECGEVLYAVPGSPLVLEQTVRRLLDDPRVDVDVLPALSFLDVAWRRLGIDPVEAGVRLVDGHRFAADVTGERGPLLVAHTHANWVLSEIKLAVEGATGDEPVTILQRLGTADEQLVETTWAELDRTVEADHLTSVYIPRLAAPVGEHYVRFHELTRTLRERCPWDQEQTHQTLAPYLIEEAFELVDAIAEQTADDERTDVDLIEELGDLLYHIEFHAAIAEEGGRFSIVDVIDNVHDKLVRRHPHVFADTATCGSRVAADAAAGTSEVTGLLDVTGSADVAANWEQIKRAEKQRDSLFDGVPTSQPALAYVQQLQRKAAKVGFDWPDVDGPLAALQRELAELDEARAAGDAEAIAAELGDVAMSLANVARHLGVDAELATRGAAQRFRTRFETVERLARERAIAIPDAGLEQLDALWDEAKRAER